MVDGQNLGEGADHHPRRDLPRQRDIPAARRSQPGGEPRERRTARRSATAPEQYDLHDSRARVRRFRGRLRYVVPGQGSPRPGCGDGFQRSGRHPSSGLTASATTMKRCTRSGAGKTCRRATGPAPPVTFKLPDGHRLRRDRRSRSAELRGHGAAVGRPARLPRAPRATAPPPNYPFKLRFGDDNVEAALRSRRRSTAVVTPPGASSLSAVT